MRSYVVFALGLGLAFLWLAGFRALLHRTQGEFVTVLLFIAGFGGIACIALGALYLDQELEENELKVKDEDGNVRIVSATRQRERLRAAFRPPGNSKNNP